VPPVPAAPTVSSAAPSQAGPPASRGGQKGSPHLFLR